MFGFNRSSTNDPSNLTPTEASEKLKVGKKNTILLDVRTGPEYKQAHVKGSLLVPVQELQSQAAKLAAHKTKEVLVICHSGSRSLSARKILLALGFDDVYNVVGGVSRWHQEGLPLEFAKGS